MTAQRNITDRALRYRAQKNMPDHPAVCVFCGLPWKDSTGARPVLEVGHVDGNESHDSADNFSWTCRSCNVEAAYVLRASGVGRLTKQFNPSKGGGAKTLGQWMQAVGAITPHVDRGERGLVSDMPVSEAVAMIRATPHSKRSQYASELRKHKRNPWPFSSRATSPRMTTPAHGGILAHSGGSKGHKSSAGAAGSHRGYTISRDAEGEYFSSLDPSSRFSTKSGAEKHIDWYLKGRGNPAQKRYYRAIDKRGNTVYYLDSRRAGRLIRVSEDEARMAQSTGAGTIGSYDIESKRFSENPSAFDMCVASAKGARDPRAVCASAGRKKYGQAEMTRRAIAGKRKAARGNPSALEKVQSQIDRLVDQMNLKGSTLANTRKLRELKEKRDRLEGLEEVYVTAPAGMRLSNPAAAADAVYEEFHGRPPDETVTIRKERHHHTHLASAGDLKKLVVLGVDEKVHTITGFKGAILAFNESKNQLFVEGGDQSVNLEDYGIRNPHEIETLGQVKDIAYFTTKDHLGDEGGTATYVHKFRTTNENGKHVTVRITRYPDLIYRVRDEQLEFSGGSYLIRAEGIDH